MKLYFLIFLIICSNIALSSPWNPTPLTGRPARSSRVVPILPDYNYKKGATYVVEKDTLAFSSLTHARRYISATNRAITAEREQAGLYDDVDFSVGRVSTETVDDVLEEIGASAIKIKKGTKVKYKYTKGSCAYVETKKGIVYINADLLISQSAWKKKTELDAAAPAKEGKAKVRRNSWAFYTDLMLEEYYKTASASEEIAKRWLMQNRGLVRFLAEGSDVIVLDIDYGEGTAKIVTPDGKIWYCMHENLSGVKKARK